MSTGSEENHSASKRKDELDDVDVNLDEVEATVVDLDVNLDDAHNPKRRQIGLVSAVFIIFNRMIGTGFMWIIGAIIAAAGMQVYIIWGTAVPKNGGEKNYLEYLFTKPKYLITSVFAANGVLLGECITHCVVEVPLLIYRHI
ncbi:hypothetical protein H0H93_015855 [Arthromyces matolae]|nr:hypothetical protein H0H93_015855 [Arthromyces matolae]